MAALSRRDIEMIFRAETDKATRPIADLGKAAKQSRGELQGLIEAAERGEVSLEKLGATTRDLKKAQDELGTARSLLTQLNAQESALDRATEKADAAAAKYAELKAQVDGAEQPTKRLVNSMEAAGRASAAAAERLDNVRREAAETREQITAIIGPVDNVGDAFRTIATTSQEIARGLAVAGQAADDFKQRINGAAAASAAADAKMNADASFQAAGQNAGLLQAQIDYISQFENRVELLAQAKRELATQNAAFDNALRAQEAKVGEANVRALRNEITETFAAAARAEQINAFRQIAADAKAASADVTRFGVAQDTVAASGQRLAQSLSMILNPGSAANRTIESVEQSVLAADAALKEGRKSAADYNAILNDLSQAGAGIDRIARGIDAFKDQKQVLDAAGASYRSAVAEVQRLAAAIDRTDEPTEEMVRELRQAEAAVEAAGTEMQRQATKAQELGNALRRAGVDANDLATAENRLAQAARQTAAASGEATARQGGKGGLFGLTPQDATNLSYQLNDIFVQLASGQSIFITLAQQGPQIWQIGGVQAYAASLSSVLVPLLAVASGFGLVAAAAVAVNKATSPDANTQAAQAFLAMLGNTADITAKQMGTAANELERFGAKTEEAREIVRNFVEAGLNPDYISAYTQSLRDAADATGVDMVDASKTLTDALNGGYDAVVKLNEQFPVLTDAEMAQVQAMYDSGQADEARQLIFDRFTSKMEDAASKMNGPWTNAWRNLQGAAAGFGSYISNTLTPYLQGLRQWLDEAAIGVNYLLLRMRGLDRNAAGNAAVNNQGRAPAPPRAGGGRVAPRARSTAAGAAAAADAEREAKAKGKQATAEDRIAAARIKARRDAQSKGYGSADEARLVAVAEGEVRAKIAEEQRKAGAKAAKSAKTARDKAAREAEAEAKRIASQAEQLENALDAMGVKVAKVSAGTLEEQLANAATAVSREYAKLYRNLDDFSKATGGKGKIGNLTIDQYREQVKANETILANQAKLKVYEDNLNDTLNERKAILAQIEERAQRGEISGAEAIRQTAEVTSRFQPIIQQLTQSAIDFATSIGGANPSPELKAFVEKMRQTQTGATGEDQEANRRSANANIGRQESELNRILSERNALVESYNTLQELGLMTSQDARAASAAAYNQSNALIDAQIAKLRQAMEAARQLGAISPQAFAAFEARMKAIGAQAQYLDPRFAQLKQSIDQVVSQNAMTAIDTIAQSFGNAIAGTEGWGDALVNAGLALLNFIGQTIRNVAQLIIQMLILDAVQKATGIPVAALLGTTAPGQAAGGGGGLFGFLGKLFHEGGKAGQVGGRSTTRISISPAAVANAPRYHEGTPAVGLKPNEQVAVLERGEKVMTEEQQRAEARAKAGGGDSVGLRQVLAFGDDEIAGAMQGPAGERVTVTHIRRNKTLIRQELGID